MNLRDLMLLTEEGKPVWFLEGGRGQTIATSAVPSAASEDGVSFGGTIHRSLSQVFATQQEALASAPQEAD